MPTRLYADVLREEPCQEAERLGTSYGVENGHTVGDECIYCNSRLEKDERQDYQSYGMGTAAQVSNWRHVHVCQKCGWWAVEHEHRLETGETYLRFTRSRRVAVLEDLDVTNIGVPLSELRNYLAIRFDKIGQVPPKMVEELVGSVFREHGYAAVVTGGSRDGGIDIVLLSAGGKGRIGVQVKRWRRKIEAEQIRAFAGALLLGGMERGIFVTTSQYRTGARETARQYGELKPFGKPIELWARDNLLAALREHRGPQYAGFDDPSAPFFPYYNGEAELVRCYDSYERHTGP